MVQGLRREPGALFRSPRTKSAAGIFTANNDEMVYLKHTTALQAIRIPSTGMQVPGAASLEIYAGIDASPVQTVEMQLRDKGGRYVDGAVRLPEGLAVGEYGFRLLQGGRCVARGIVYVGEFARVTNEATGVSEIVFKQYGEK